MSLKNTFRSDLRFRKKDQQYQLIYCHVLIGPCSYISMPPGFNAYQLYQVRTAVKATSL